MGAAASTGLSAPPQAVLPLASLSSLSDETCSAIKTLSASAQEELAATSVSAETLAAIKTLPAAAQAELEAVWAEVQADAQVEAQAAEARANGTPCLAERIAAPVFHPFRWVEATKAVRACASGHGGSVLTLPQMCELSAALIELPHLATLHITGGTRELLESHRLVLEKEGCGDGLRALLRGEKASRLGRYATLDVLERRALLEAVGGCCNDENRERVRSTIGAILSGDVSALQLDEYAEQVSTPRFPTTARLRAIRRSSVCGPRCTGRWRATRRRRSSSWASWRSSAYSTSHATSSGRCRSTSATCTRFSSCCCTTAASPSCPPRWDGCRHHRS